MSTLNISLEPHLIDRLLPIFPLVPAETASQLAPYVSETPPPTVPYDLLLLVSQWCRSESGVDALESASLHPQSYTMTALLAGTMTSPERNLPPFTPAPSPEEAAFAKRSERQAITALLNALLSIIGSGFAGWWAAGRTGWKSEWQVLFALSVAIVVAISEGVLYLIWESRRSKSKTPKKLRLPAARKKELADRADITPMRVEHGLPKLRQRLVAAADAST